MFPFVPGPLAPVPSGPIGFDALPGLAVLTALVGVTGGSVLIAALLERGRRWCAERARPTAVAASQPA